LQELIAGNRLVIAHQLVVISRQQFLFDRSIEQQTKSEAIAERSASPVHVTVLLVISSLEISPVTCHGKVGQKRLTPLVGNWQ